MWTSNFWQQSAERALKTLAQTVLALITAGPGLGLLDVACGTVASVGALAAFASILTSIVSTGAGQPADPSLVRR